MLKINSKFCRNLFLPIVHTLYLFFTKQKGCQGIRLIVNIVPCVMDELPIWQSHSQPVNPSHVTNNGLAHYCTHNASVNNSI